MTDKDRIEQLEADCAAMRLALEAIRQCCDNPANVGWDQVGKAIDAALAADSGKAFRERLGRRNPPGLLGVNLMDRKWTEKYDAATKARAAIDAAMERAE